MDRRPCPQATVFFENAGDIEVLGDFAFSVLVRDKSCVNLLDYLDHIDLLLGTRAQNDTVRLQALSLSQVEQPLGA